MAYYRFDCNHGAIPSNLTVVAAIVNNKQKKCKHCKHCARRALEASGGVSENNSLKPGNPLVAWQQYICERKTIAQKIMNRTGKNVCQLLFNRSSTVDARDKATVQRMMEHADRMNPDYLMKRVVFYDRLPNGCCVAGPESIVPTPKEHKADRAYEITGLPAISKQEMLGENSCRRRSMFINSKLFQQGMRKKKREIRSVVEFFPDIEFLQVVGKAIPFTKTEDDEKLNSIPAHLHEPKQVPDTDIQEEMLSTATEQNNKKLKNFQVILNEPLCTENTCSKMAADFAGKDASASKVIFNEPMCTENTCSKMAADLAVKDASASKVILNEPMCTENTCSKMATDLAGKDASASKVILNEPMCTENTCSKMATDLAAKDASASKVILNEPMCTENTCSKMATDLAGKDASASKVSIIPTQVPDTDIQEGMLSTATEQYDKNLNNFPVILDEPMCTESTCSKMADDLAGKDASASKVSIIPKQVSATDIQEGMLSTATQNPKDLFKSKSNAFGTKRKERHVAISEAKNTNLKVASAPLVPKTILSTSIAPTHRSEKSSKLSYKTNPSSANANIVEGVLSKSLKQAKTESDLNAYKSEDTHDASKLNNFNRKETTSNSEKNVTVSESNKPDFKGHASSQIINTTDVNEMDTTAESNKPASESDALLDCACSQINTSNTDTTAKWNKTASESDALLDCACSQINTSDTDTTAKSNKLDSEGDASLSCVCSETNNTDVEGGTAVEPINSDTETDASTVCACSKMSTPDGDEIGTRSPDAGKLETSATDNHISEFLLEKFNHITPSGTKIFEDVGEVCTKVCCDHSHEEETPENVDLMEMQACKSCKNVQPDDDDSVLFMMEMHSCSCCGIICHCKGNQTSSDSMSTVV